MSIPVFLIFENVVRKQRKIIDIISSRICGPKPLLIDAADTGWRTRRRLIWIKFQASRTIDIANRKVSDATGQLVYSGGQLRARVERQSVDTELPMLVANLMMEGDKLVVPVATAEGDPLGQLFMQPDGWGGMTVLRRAVDIAGQSWPDKQAEPDTVIFEVSQKFL